MKQKLNLTQIGKILNRSRESVAKYLRKNSIIKKLKVAKHQIDESYFEKIDSHEKAYWLGILLTDGCLKGNNKYEINLQFQERDIELLEAFKRCLKSEHPIKHRFNGNGKNGELRSVIFRFGSKKITNDLRKFAMKEAKSLTLEFPNIDDKYMFSFLCGAFIGDGNFSLYNSKTGYLKFKVSLVSASRLFIKGVLENCRRLGWPLNLAISKTPKGTSVYITYTSNREYAVKFLDKLFENINETLYLKRKYEIYLLAKQSLIDHPLKPIGLGKRIPQNYKNII